MNRICAERHLKDMTQTDLANSIEVDKSTIVRWEGGGDISQKHIEKMRELFGCDADWLLGLSSERRNMTGT